MSARSFNRSLRQCQQALQDVQILSSEYSSSQRSASVPCCRWHNHASAGQKARFSTTRSRSKHLTRVPSFKVTPSNDLNQLFLKLRTRLFLPAFLTAGQRKLIYQQKYKSMLIYDPVVVGVGGEDFTLEHLDRMKDIPNTWTSIRTAMDNMRPGTQADWVNLIPLLQGFNRAGIKLKQRQWAVIIRRLATEDVANLLVEIVRRGDTTGLRLTDIESAKEVLLAFHSVAHRGEWSHDSIERALRYATNVALQMEEKNHMGDSAIANRFDDPRASPEIIGIMLELTAAQAMKSYNGVDKSGLVEITLQRLLPNLQRAFLDGTHAVRPPSKPDADPTEDATARKAHLTTWTPVWNGLRLARKVLDAQTPQASAADKAIAELEDSLEASYRSVTAETSAPTDGDNKAGPRGARAAALRGFQWYADYKANFDDTFTPSTAPAPPSSVEDALGSSAEDVAGAGGAEETTATEKA